MKSNGRPFPPRGAVLSNEVYFLKNKIWKPKPHTSYTGTNAIPIEETAFFDYVELNGKEKDNE